MKGKLIAQALIVLGAATVVGAQSGGPSPDEISRTIAIASKVGTSEPLTDRDKQYGLGLRLLERQGPIVIALQGPLNRVFNDARSAVARHQSYTAADVSDAAREPIVAAIAMPNRTYQYWDARGPVRISEVVFKVTRPGSKEPQVIHAPGGCQFNPLDFKKPSGEIYKSQLATCKFPLDVVSAPAARFEVAVIHDQGEWSRVLQPEELRMIR